MSRGKLLLGIITAVTRAAGIFCGCYHASLPSRVTATAGRKQRLHTRFCWNRERLSQPLGSLIFLWLMLSAHYLKSARSKGSVRVFALHLCVTLHPARAPLPITHRAHFLITPLPFGQSPTPALSEHTAQAKKESLSFSVQFSAESQWVVWLLVLFWK